MHLSAMGAGAAGSLNGLLASPVHSLKKGKVRPCSLLSSNKIEVTPSLMAAARGTSMSLSLGQQQVAGLARAATLEQLREKLETGEGPERKMARLAEEQQQRLMQQAFQHNLLAMASQVPMNLRLGNSTTARVGYADVCCKTPTRKYEKQQDMALSISTNGSASISVSVEVNGTLYSGTLFAQKSGAPGTSVSTAVTVPPAGPSAGFGFTTSAHSHSPSSSSSSKGPCSAEPSTSGSP
ncbi:unnamed protein product [Oncorhynchus mykiss]|uniref:REKLES domain-containing protein n=1 Tax=Oncorhynchus mykiss TaxID=8022 RepID=A0A060WHQ9_ONCMY|nr:unnamed protein product [Oncorhynchus mykiss]